MKLIVIWLSDHFSLTPTRSFLPEPYRINSYTLISLYLYYLYFDYTFYISLPPPRYIIIIINCTLSLQISNTHYLYRCILSQLAHFSFYTFHWVLHIYIHTHRRSSIFNSKQALPPPPTRQEYAYPEKKPVQPWTVVLFHPSKRKI